MLMRLKIPKPHHIKNYAVLRIIFIAGFIVFIRAKIIYRKGTLV